MKYKFGICGPFDFEEKSTGGQSVKTREFYYAFFEKVGKEKIVILESTGYKINPIGFTVKLIKMLKQCEHTIILPAQNGIRVLAPLCNCFRGKGKLHYCVIGGWLPQLVKEHKKLLNDISKFNTVLVETTIMKKRLEKAGLSNIYHLRNLKRIHPVEKVENCHEPVKLCFFSRVMREKGIEDAVEAVNALNTKERKCIFDIYGPVVEEYREDFEKLKQKFGTDIRYKGIAKPENSVKILQNYDLQLFPTRYRTEGVPGSIIDSYFSAVPVIASRWDGFEDVVKDGVTGIGFELGNTEELVEYLERLIEDKILINSMKKKCIKEAEKYTSERVIENFMTVIGEGGYGDNPV